VKPVKIAYPLLLLALLAPAAASAQTPPPDERAAARMAEATSRALTELEAMHDGAGDGSSQPCRPLEGLPERRERGGFIVFADAFIRHNAPTVAARVLVLRSELADIETADPALKSGRAAWRRWGRRLETIKPHLGDPCRAVARWRRGGYPSAPVREAGRALTTYNPSKGLAQHTHTATLRMIELGVPRELARSFDLSQ
jgi:hypothetical protein